MYSYVYFLRLQQLVSLEIQLECDLTNLRSNRHNLGQHGRELKPKT